MSEIKTLPILPLRDIVVFPPQPVPLFVEVTAVGRVVKDRGSYFEGAGEMFLPDGTVAVEAKGKFWKLPLGEIADFDTDREQWRVVPDA